MKRSYPRWICLLLLSPCLATAGEVYQSAKKNSTLVNSEMRENAARNVERFSWAAARRDLLKRRLAPYLSATDEQLWEIVPAPEIPRAGAVIKEDIPPPGTGGKHFSAKPERTRGYGINPTYYFFDPFAEPWKVQSRGAKTWYPENDFAAYYRSGLDEYGRFHVEKAESKFLQNGGRPGDDGWGARIEGKTYFFAAHYAFRVWVELFEATRDLAELYTLTGDPACAHKAGVLLARIADFFPDMDTKEAFRRGIESTTGGVGVGKMVGRIWDSYGAQGFAKAYDWAFDALATDQDLARFVAGKKLKNWPHAISGPRDVLDHIEKNLILGMIASIRNGDIAGNDGMPQLSMATVALALDDPRETPAALDWLFDPKGGDLYGALVDRMSRDGLGVESGIGYQMIPPKSFIEVAMLLEKYPSYPRSDLLTIFPKLRKGLRAGEAIKILDGAIANIGDGGTAMRYGRTGYPMPVPVAKKGWQLHGDNTSTQLLLDALAGDPESLPGDIYAAEPEEERSRIISALKSLGPREYDSFLSGGYGMGALQAPYREAPRALAMNYGPTGWGGHGHGDKLGVHLFSQGAYMMTDLGYPTFTGAWPPRVGWISHTVSHNTVMVDDQPMERRSSFSGKTQLFAQAGPVRVFDVDAAGEKVLRGQGHSGTVSKALPIYPQVETFRRCLVMIDIDAKNSYYLDCFWVRGGNKHRLMQNGGGVEVSSDWPKWEQQGPGTLAGKNVAFGQFYDGPSDWNYRGSGLMFLKNVARAQPDKAFWVDWKILPPFVTLPASADVHLRVHNLGPIQEAALANGEAPRGGPKEMRYLSRLREGQHLASQFISIFEPYEKTPSIREVRLLANEELPEGFAVAVEVTLSDGRRDMLGLTENGGKLKKDSFELSGRLGWLRLNAKGAILERVLIDAESVAWNGIETKLDPPRFSGRIGGMDSSDPSHVTIHLDSNLLPENAGERWLIVDNHQRSDAAFALQGLSGSRADLGETPLDEVYAKPGDPTSELAKTISEGDEFFIPNFLYQKTDP